MNITKQNAYEVIQELSHQAKNSNALADEIATAIQVVENNKLPPRKYKDVFRFFANEGLTHEWVTDTDGNIVGCAIHKDGIFDAIASVPCNGISSEGLRYAIEYVMDQEEL